MTREGKMNTYRTTARIVGLLFVAGMVIGIGGNVLNLSILGAPDPLSNVSANTLLVAVAAFLWLMTVVGDAAHGVLMFPILKLHNERIAIGYLAARIVDAVFIAVMALFILLQIPLASEYLTAGGSDTSYLQALSTMFVQGNLYAYHIAMSTGHSWFRGLWPSGAWLDTRPFFAGLCWKSWGSTCFRSTRFRAACGSFS
jgi:Domain of unknown function (DUF4386)